jgi:hypothetical protein
MPNRLGATLGVTYHRQVGVLLRLGVTYHRQVGGNRYKRHGEIVRVGIQEGVIQEGVIQEGAIQVVRHRHQVGRLHIIGRLGLLTVLPLMMLIPPPSRTSSDRS